ncbi:hypothetical protein BaRGS_00005295 [Batillaria attramentaria]|uniref:Laminin EGF-like domain-containing protein n=1 Tax=Batillaria attramentaria TaxID=370345 RepID=A0ABD0LUU4_9CAEN
MEQTAVKLLVCFSALAQCGVGQDLELGRLTNTRITVDDVECHSIGSTPPPRQYSFTCNTVLYGQRVKISRNYYLLNMCEFEVLACSPGYYGDQCDARCIDSHCLYCDQETGTHCYESCPAGRYGNHCYQKCRARRCKNGQCDVVTGLCTQCDGNYVGSHCRDCARGFYGGSCDQSCSAGCPNSECDQQTGHCQPCNSSYWGDRCDKQCPSGCLTSQCDEQTGRCSSCENGYWGDKCDQQCSTGCQNSQCDQQTGYCQPCRSGYWGDFCNETCLSSRCKNNQCNQADGLCLECRAPFFELPYCECEDGYYYNDTYCIKCPVQCYNTPCNKTTGHCDSCPPGRRGNTCSEVKSCGACLSGAACNTVTGECSESALDGMVGPIVGAIIGGMVFLGISIMVAACWIRRRHKLSTKDRSDGNTDVELKSANFPEACADEPKQSDANTDEAAYSEIMDTPNVVLVDVTQKDDDDTSESGHYYSPLDGPRGERSLYTKPVFKDVPAASDNQDYANAEVSQSQVYVNTSVRDNSP